MLIGHVAISALEHRYLDAGLIPVMVAGLAPDLIDKTACQILHLTPNGRMWGHTLVGLLLSTLLVHWRWGERAAQSWALGYASHLLCDGNHQVPWLYPFRTYDFPPSPSLHDIITRFLHDPTRLGLETILVGWAIIALMF